MARHGVDNAAFDDLERIVVVMLTVRTLKAQL
jgi:hypothetical protein